MDLDLHVVPRRSGTVAVIVELRGLRITAVVFVVVAAVAQVDATDERDVVGRIVRVADDDELLVMAAAAPHPLVEQDLVPRRR